MSALLTEGASNGYQPSKAPASNKLLRPGMTAVADIMMSLHAPNRRQIIIAAAYSAARRGEA